MSVFHCINSANLCNKVSKIQCHFTGELDETCRVAFAFLESNTERVCLSVLLLSGFALSDIYRILLTCILLLMPFSAGS